MQLIEQLEQSLPDDEDEEFLAMVEARIAASDAAGPCSPADEVFERLLANSPRPGSKLVGRFAGVSGRGAVNVLMIQHLTVLK
jgi:hypothetical protein